MEETSQGNRRLSVKPRLRTEGDINSWVQANRSAYAAVDTEPEYHVHFEPPGHGGGNESICSSESSSEDSEDMQPVALDGGYAWVIVLISFMIHLICDGLSFSFGIIFPVIQQEFNCSKFAASIVGSFYLALPLLAGPIAGTLTDIYDCRLTTIIGGGMATFGVLLAYISPRNIIFFGLNFGIITAIGLCFCYNSGIVVVTYYFEKNRALATALAVCGSGAGTFIFPPLIELVFFQLLTSFSFWPTILCFAFFFFLLVLLGFAMRDVEWPNESQEYKQKKFLKKLDKMRERDRESIRGGDTAGFHSLMPIRDSLLSDPRRACSLPVIPNYADDLLRRIEPSASIQSIRKAVSSLQDPVARSRSVGVFASNKPQAVLPTVPEYSMIDTKLEHLDLQLSNSPYATVNSRNRVRMYSNCSLSMDALDQIQPKNADADEESSSDSEMSNDGDSSSSELSDQILTKKKEVTIGGVTTVEPMIHIENGIAVEPTKGHTHPVAATQSARAVRSSVIGGFTHSRVPASNAMGLRYVVLREPMFRGLQAKAPSAPALFVKKKKKKSLREVLHLKQMRTTISDTITDYRRLSSDPRFSAFLVSIFILYMFFDIPYVNFPEYTQEHLGIPVNETSWLVSGIGLFNLISMVLCGLVCDKPFARKNLFLLYGVMIIMAGICLLTSTMTTSYAMMQVISCGYGFFIAANYVLASVLLCELICVSDFQNGYGFLCLVEGVANLIGPALVGWVRDVSKSYESMFTVGGIGVIISGAIVVVVHFTLPEDDGASTSSSSSPKAKSKKNSSSRTVAAEELMERLLNTNSVTDTNNAVNSNGQNNTLLVPPLNLNN